MGRPSIGGGDRAQERVLFILPCGRQGSLLKSEGHPLKVWRLQAIFDSSFPPESQGPVCQSFVNRAPAPLTVALGCHTFTCTMHAKNFDQLLKDYRQAIDAWVAAIRAEEALANDDHSMVEMEKWDAAGFTEHDAEAVAKKARDQYKNALRKKNYGF